MMKELVHNDRRIIVDKFIIATTFFTVVKLNCTIWFLLLKPTTSAV